MILLLRQYKPNNTFNPKKVIKELKIAGKRVKSIITEGKKELLYAS